MSARIVVMSKVPAPGLAKTRLALAIGDDAAAALAARMLNHTLATARSSSVGTLELCRTPDIAHPALRAAAARFGAVLSEQGSGDLGQRMARIAVRVLAGGELPIIVGSDCPSLAPHHLRLAVQILQIHDAVFQPTFDGGYALIGLRRFQPRLFEAIPWSTASVMATTRERLRELEWSWCEGEPLHDIDTAADLDYLPKAWRSVVRQEMENR
jgi:rSAM/selenodomain-associated transferase 1